LSVMPLVLPPLVAALAGD